MADYNKEWYYANGYGEYYEKHIATIPGINADSPLSSPIDKLAFLNYQVSDKVAEVAKNAKNNFIFLAVAAVAIFIFMKWSK